MSQGDWWKLFAAVMPEWDQLRRAASAYQNGDYQNAIRLAEEAVATAASLERADVVAQASQLVSMCKAQLDGRSIPGAVPEACAYCCTTEGVPTLEAEPYVY